MIKQNTCGIWVTAVAAVAASTSCGADTHQHEVIAPGTPVPGESIYQLELSLTDQNGQSTMLSALRGKPTLITLFYTSCQGVCPLLAVTLRNIEESLSAQERQGLKTVMVSFDPQRDTPQALGEFAKLHQPEGSNWLLARTAEDNVRELAAVLGIRYRPLPDGVFSHSAVIALLDADGVVRARTEMLQELDPQFMQTLRAMLPEPAS